MYECSHECLHNFQHYAAYSKISKHGEEEDLMNKDVINHDSF